MRPRRSLLLVLGLAAGLQAQTEAPDLVLVNGKIFTADAKLKFVEALAIRGERITAAGTSAEVTALAGPNTRRIDLGGRVVIPGINDAHTHFAPAPDHVTLKLAGMDPTWAQVQAAVAEAAQSAPKGKLLVGTIGGAVLETPEATRDALDRIAGDHPVILACWTGHSQVVDTAALRLLGITDTAADPEGGWYERDAAGKLNGRLFEYATMHPQLSAHLPESAVIDFWRAVAQKAAKLGITSVENMSFRPVKEDVAVLKKAAILLRVRVIRTPYSAGDAAATSIEGAPPMVTVSGTKYILDGTPVERTAWMRRPYSDRPDTSGRMDFTPDQLRLILREATRTGSQLLFHAVGDRTLETLLKEMDHMNRREKWRERRPRIEHGDMLTPDMIPLVRKLGVIIVQNPTHLALKDILTERWSARVTQAQPLASLLAAGIPLALGSDGPMNPYLNIMLACTHPDRPLEALTREQTVVAYTSTAAYAEFAEKDKGTLAPGKLADLAVLSQDIFEVSFDDLSKTVSVLTLVGGKVAWDAGVMK